MKVLEIKVAVHDEHVRDLMEWVINANLVAGTPLADVVMLGMSVREPDLDELLDFNSCTRVK